MITTFALDEIPAEIRENISEYLDLEDLQALRLTSRRVCSASSHETFKRHFRTKTVYLSNASALQRLRDSIIESEYSRELQHLDLLLADDQPIDTANLESIAPAALCAIQQHSGVLRRLSVNLEEKPHLDDWKRAWHVVADGWEVLMRSLATSGLLIDELDAFTKSTGSISIDRISSLLPSAALAGCFSRLRSLDLSLSHSPEQERDALHDSADHSSEHEDGSLDSFIYSDHFMEKMQNYFISVCDFVSLCPGLHHLGLHWYSVSYLEDNEPLLDFIVRRCVISNIRSASLRGMHTSSKALLQLAKGSQLTSLKMEYVRIENDTFRPSFDYVSPDLNFVKLGQLYELNMIDFETSTGTSPELIREGNSAKEIIKYYPFRVFRNGDASLELAKIYHDFGRPS